MIPLRDDTPSSSPPIVTVALILACAAVFLYMFYGIGSQAALERFILAYGAVPAELLSPGRLSSEGPTLLTAMFLHGGWAHLIGNMLFLWIFGDNVEDLMGHGGFLLFYLLAGVIATGAHVVLNSSSAAPLIGASGAIAGVLGAYLVLFPRARILSLVPFGLFSRLVAVPAVLFLPLWFVLQFVYGVVSLAGDVTTVAWWAHVGGFVAGILLVPLFTHRRRHR